MELIYGLKFGGNVWSQEANMRIIMVFKAGKLGKITSRQGGDLGLIPGVLQC